MNFLHPAAWWALLLGLVVIALYLIRTRLPRQVVSTALFWEQVAPPRSSSALWRRLRRWCSLLLQLLFLAALVFALAQPLAAWQTLHPAALVLVLDPSPSMEATEVAPSRWGRAVAEAQERLQGLRAFDEATLLLAADPPQVLSGWTRSKRALQRALAEARPSGREGDPRPALRLARSLAAGRPGGKVTLWTDGVWAQPPGEALLSGVETRWLGGAGVNAGFTLLAARRALTGPGEWQLAARVEAHGPAAVSGQVELWREGRVLDAQALTLQPGQPWEHTWSGRAEGAVRFEARLTGFPPDHLARDDRALAALPAQPRFPVQLVSPPHPFLEAALQALPQVSWQRTGPEEELGPARPGTLYIFHRSLPPAGFAAEACLLIAPTASGPWGERRGVLEQPLVSEFRRDSPLLRHAGLQNVSLQTAQEFAPAPGAEVLAESFGKPLLFGHWREAPRWLVLPFELENTDLVLRTAFPILLGNVVESLRPETPAEGGETLPGPTESALVRTAATAAPPAGEASAPGAWWSRYPLWWWAVAAGVGWLLGEWWTWTRRLTE